MAAINFPDPNVSNPETGNPYKDGWYNSSNGVTYVYTNGVWRAASSEQSFEDIFVNKSGDDMTGNLTVPSLNGGPLAGFRNQIINGDFRINQRGQAAYTAGRADPYTVDRWVTGTGETVSPFTDSNVLPNGAVAGIEIVPTAAAYISQYVEIPPAGTNAPSQFAVGSTWTLSIWTDQPSNCELNVDYRRANVAPNAWTKVGGIQQLETSGIYTRIAQTFTAIARPVDVDYVAINFANLTPNQLTRLSNCQLEPGPVATPFEHRPIGTELALCQRYCFVISGQTTGGYTSQTMHCTDGTSAASRYNFQLPVPMRTVPSLTPVNTNNDTIEVYNYNVNSAKSFNDFSLQESTNQNIFMICGHEDGNTIGDLLAWRFKLDPEAYLIYTAEL